MRPADFARSLVPFGWARRTILLLVMQVNDNSLELVRRRRWYWPWARVLDSRNPNAGEKRNQSYIPIANEMARRVAKKIGGWPASSINEVLLDIPSTAHMLGGACIGSDPATGCRQALQAARLMSEHLVELNTALENDLGEPLRIGIGLHFGPTIVGEMGYSKTVSLTAVGDAVNTASRLESASKEYACELVVSEDLLTRAGIDLTASPRHEIAIRGRQQMLAVRTLNWGRDLPAFAAARTTVPA